MRDLVQDASRAMYLQAAVTLGFGGLVIGYSIFFRSGAADIWLPAIAAGYGGLVGIASTWLSRRSVDRATRAAKESTALAMVPVYVGLLNKFLIVGGGLAFGLILLGLPPLFVVAGYVVSQLALVVFMIKLA